MATEVVEAAGLGAGEPCSEAVQALSAAGVSSRVSENDTAGYVKSLTCGWTRGIYHVLRNALPLHPPLDFLSWHLASSNSKFEFPFISFHKLPSLSLLHHHLHLIWFDVLVQAPLAQSRSILPNPSTVSQVSTAYESSSLTLR
jgi:hypothetical protein